MPTSANPYHAWKIEEKENIAAVAISLGVYFLGVEQPEQLGLLLQGNSVSKATVNNEILYKRPLGYQWKKNSYLRSQDKPRNKAITCNAGIQVITVADIHFVRLHLKSRWNGVMAGTHSCWNSSTMITHCAMIVIVKANVSYHLKTNRQFVDLETEILLLNQ